MTSHRFLAFDLGAESGRAVVGTLDDGQLRIRELHRFPNGMVNVRGHWHWNVFRLYEEIKRGLKACAAEINASPASLGGGHLGRGLWAGGPGWVLGARATLKGLRS